MIVLFAACFLLLAHTYLGYPLSLILLRILRRPISRHHQSPIEPTVSLVISAHNEEKVIAKKMRNVMALDYPRNRLQVVVISDASSDGTNDIVERFRDMAIEIRKFPERQGKVECLNRVIPSLSGELVVMSDANSMYERDALRKLIRHFGDPRVGCVCGNLRYVNPERIMAGEGEKVYWSYEEVIKNLESSLGVLLGANGAIYAYPRKHFEPVSPLMFCDDVIPIRIALRGLRTIYDPEAVCTEESVPEGAEMRRRRRHASFGLRSMLHLSRKAIARGKWLILYECVCHRIMRWLGGIALLGVLAATPFLPSPLRGILIVLQGAFYGGSLLGFVTSRLGWKNTLLYLPYYYSVITLAGLMGLGAYLLRTDLPYWGPRR